MLTSPIRSLCILSVLCPSADAQITLRASIHSNGQQGSGSSDCRANSLRGHFLVFTSDSSNIVAGDTNGVVDLFLHDLQLRTTERVNLSSSGAQANGGGNPFCGVTEDGRFVAFDSAATNLSSGAFNTWGDVFVRARDTGTTELVSLDSDGVPGNGTSQYPAISNDGNRVAFSSFATNLVANDTNDNPDIFVRDRQSSVTFRASISSQGWQGNQGSGSAAISGDGRFAAFSGQSSNLTDNGTGFQKKVFVRDLDGGITQLASVNAANVQSNLDSSDPSISDDGRFVAFESLGSNLVAGDTNGVSDIFVRDMVLGTTERVSVSSTHVQANAACHGAAISGDGRWVAFWSGATTLVSGDTNGFFDVFVHDRQTGITERVSVSSAGVQGNQVSRFPSIASGGRYVSFASEAGNLVSGDTNAMVDAFVRDRAASGFASVCDAGTDGVASCPCNNPPQHAGQGCDNSSATGGAVLSASGSAYLSFDGLTFTTAGEGASALSIVMQGNGSIPGGSLYGQGVRCLGGSVIRRLYTKQAVGGSIVAPDPGALDQPVSAESAARGDVIHAGESRWYLVYYRDPIVLGGCPASRTFNATQTGVVTWSH